MLSALNIEGGSPSYGTIGLLSPLAQVPTNNFSQIQQIYQNLPQLGLGRSIILPLHYNYKSLDQQNDQHQDFQELQVRSPYTSRLNGNRNIRNGDYYIPNRRIQEHAVLSKRDGWDHGHGWDTGHKNSPALSALALLGFMFFLNLIQNSLQNNRNMLAAAAMSSTTMQATGRKMARRDVLNRMPPKSPEIIANFWKTLHSFGNTLSNKYDRKISKIPEPNTFDNNEFNKTHPQDRHVQFVSSAKRKMAKSKTNTTAMMDTFKQATLNCLQLLSCKLSKQLFPDLDVMSAILVDTFRKSLLTSIPAKSWSGIIMQAFSHGCENRMCENLYNQCIFLNELNFKVSDKTN